jgi:hypothetical protein
MLVKKKNRSNLESLFIITSGIVLIHHRLVLLQPFGKRVDLLLEIFDLLPGLTQVGAQNA